jgi:hypothetical protein
MFKFLLKIPAVRNLVVSWLVELLLKYAKKRYDKWQARIERAEKLKEEIKKIDEEILSDNSRVDEAGISKDK